MVVDHDNSPPTITLEFELYCDDAWKKGLLGTSLFLVATCMVGVVGVISNNYGRKMGLIFSFCIGSSAVIFLGMIVINYWVTFLIYCIMGFVIPYLNFSSLWLNEIGN